jgi:hypothetical protein
VLERVFLAISTAVLLASAVLILVLDVTVADVDPLQVPLSYYAHTAGAVMWRAAAALAAAGVAIVAVSSTRQAAPPGVQTGLYAAALGLATTGLFISDPWYPWEKPPTTIGWIHLLGVTLVSVSFVAVAASSRGASAVLPWSHAPATTANLGRALLAVVAGLFAYTTVSAIAGRPPAFFGIGERIVLDLALAWCAIPGLLYLFYLARRRS